MGIAQADIILRSAIIEGIREIRENNTLIDDMLEELLDDDLTSDKYGSLTIAACKDWFIHSKITVRLGILTAGMTFPVVAISLAGGTEIDNTLSDLDWDGPTQYSTDTVPLQRGRFGVDFSESYRIQCAAHGEPEFASFLYSVVLFALFRARNKYLEQRGLMISSYNPGPFGQLSDGKDLIFGREIVISGKIRHTWPGTYGTTLNAVTTNTITEEIADLGTVESNVDNLETLLEKDMLEGLEV
jgi:hypothetical protein